MTGIRHKVCKCCGHPLAADGIESKLTPQQYRMFQVVQRAGQAGISRADLMEQVYANRANGGPDFMNVLNVQKHLMAPALHYFGLAIVSTRGRNAMWRLVTIDREGPVKSLLP